MLISESLALKSAQHKIDNIIDTLSYASGCRADTFIHIYIKKKCKDMADVKRKTWLRVILPRKESVALDDGLTRRMLWMLSLISLCSVFKVHSGMTPWTEWIMRGAFQRCLHPDFTHGISSEITSC